MKMVMGSGDVPGYRIMRTAPLLYVVEVGVGVSIAIESIFDRVDKLGAGGLYLENRSIFQRDYCHCNDSK